MDDIVIDFIFRDPSLLAMKAIMAMSAAPEQLYDTLAPIPPVVRALLLGFGDHSRVDVQYGAEESDGY